MRRLTLTGGVLLICLLIAGQAEARHASWVPGSPTYVTEDDMNRLLQQTVDSAYCNGIPRFGHRGSFPDEEFVYFDCELNRNGTYCSQVRFRAIKGARYDYFKAKYVHTYGGCY